MSEAEATAGAESHVLAARELPSAVNSPELMAEHLKLNGGKTRTRFPRSLTDIFMWVTASPCA